MYKKPATLKKGRQFLLRFNIKKPRYFMLRNFSWNFWSCLFYTKSMKLCVTWRLYIYRTRHFAKNKTTCVMLLYSKIRTLCVTNFFIEVLKLVEEGAFLYAKNNALCVYFYAKKIMDFALRFYIQKAWQFTSHF